MNQSTRTVQGSRSRGINEGTYPPRPLLRRCNISIAEEYEWIGKWRMEAFEGI
jgi:hypothetical protein